MSEIRVQLSGEIGPFVCSACNILQSEVRGCRQISTRYDECFHLNVNQSVYLQNYFECEGRTDDS